MNLIDEALRRAIHEGVFPGAAYLVSRNGRSIQGAVGRLTYDTESPATSIQTVWDLASVSKVIATTSAVMILVQEGILDLHEPVAKVIPEFAVHSKEKITFQNLLTHDSGLVAFRPYHRTYTESSKVLSAIYDEQLVYETGTKSVYSDLSMILMAEAVRRLSYESLENYLRLKVFEPLGMTSTGYFRLDTDSFLSKINRLDCAPTEKTEAWRRSLRLKRYGTIRSNRLFGENPEFIQGEVHDPTATVLEGVAGHAGLFSTISDLGAYMSNFTATKPKLFAPEVRDRFIKKQSIVSSRALGWDTKSPDGSSSGSLFGSRSFGHTGYTGTSIWADPDANVFAILLTNRVHPTSENTKILQFRQVFHDLAFEASF